MTTQPFSQGPQVFLLYQNGLFGPRSLLLSHVIRTIASGGLTSGPIFFFSTLFLIHLLESEQKSGYWIPDWHLLFLCHSPLVRTRQGGP